MIGKSMTFEEQLFAVTQMRIETTHYLQLGAFGVALLTLQNGLAERNTSAFWLGIITLTGCAIVLVAGYILQTDAAELVGSSKARTGDFASPNHFFREHGLTAFYKNVVYISGITFFTFCLTMTLAISERSKKKGDM